MRVARLNARYRAIYLAPIVVGLLGGTFVGLIFTYYLIELLGMATETAPRKALAIFIFLSVWALLFFVFSAATVGVMILLRLISTKDGLLMLTGRGVPTEWYES